MGCNRLRMAHVCAALVCSIVAVSCTPRKTPPPAASSPFTYEQRMIPVRDGMHLQTVILTPKRRSGPLPILLARTPYGVPDKAPTTMPDDLKALARDGYIFVVQNVRGRFKSEGVFSMNNVAPKGPNEITDAYDTINWLAKNVPNNN